MAPTTTMTLRSLLLTLTVLLLVAVSGFLAASTPCDKTIVTCVNRTECPPAPAPESCCSGKLYYCYNCVYCLVYLDKGAPCRPFARNNAECNPKYQCQGSGVCG